MGELEVDRFTWANVVLGILANAGATALACGAYGVAAWAALRRQRRLHRPASSGPWLLGLITVYLGVAALRQVAAAGSVSDAAWIDIDRALYWVVIHPAAFVILPHVHLVVLVATGSLRWARGLAAGLLVVVLVGLVFAYTGGIDGPVSSAYGTDWTLRSPVTKIVLVAAIMLPGLIGSGLLVLLSRRLAGLDSRRVRLLGWSCLAYFLVFTADALGLEGLALLGARFAMVGTGFLAWWAYQDPPGTTAVAAAGPRDPYFG